MPAKRFYLWQKGYNARTHSTVPLSRYGNGPRRSAARNVSPKVSAQIRALVEENSLLATVTSFAEEICWFLYPLCTSRLLLRSCLHQPCTSRVPSRASQQFLRLSKLILHLSSAGKSFLKMILNHLLRCHPSLLSATLSCLHSRGLILQYGVKSRVKS